MRAQTNDMKIRGRRTFQYKLLIDGFHDFSGHGNGFHTLLHRIDELCILVLDAEPLVHLIQLRNGYRLEMAEENRLS